MGPSWTAAPSRSTSLARAKSVRAEAAVVANLAVVVAVAVAVAATRKSARFYPARLGRKPGLAFFVVPWSLKPLNRGKTSNIQHRTPNAEVSEDSRCHSWMFDVGCSSGFMGQGGVFGNP